MIRVLSECRRPYLFDLYARLAVLGSRERRQLSHIDHNEFIDVGVPILVEPAVGERHFPFYFMALALIGDPRQVELKSAGLRVLCRIFQILLSPVRCFWLLLCCDMTTLLRRAEVGIFHYSHPAIASQD